MIDYKMFIYKKKIYIFPFFSHAIALYNKIRPLVGEEDFIELQKEDVVNLILKLKKTLEEGNTYLGRHFATYNSEIPFEEKQKGWNTAFGRFPFFRFCGISPRAFLKGALP